MFIRTYIFVPFLAALAFFAACTSQPTNQEISLQGFGHEDGWALPPDHNKNAYGIVQDDYFEIEDKVKRNEHLASILAKYKVDYSDIHELVKQSYNIFDVRDLRTGQPYKVYCTKDSAQDFRCFVYEKDPIEYVVFELGDSAKVYTGRKEVKTIIDSVGGEINGSLWVTLSEQGVPPYLAVKLSEVFAWQIDFFRINKGDRFKVIYETTYVEGEPIGLGNILAAQFAHLDKDFYAFRFEQDSVLDYFDENGQSLRKAFLKAPLKYSRISSGFTRKRFHPVLKRYKAHLGVDYAAPTGTPVYAVGDGKVIEAGYKGGNGRYVKIKHNGTYTTGYLHFSKIAKGIKSGVYVKQGDVIGYVGSTGLATGPHLCFRFFKNGEQVNALKVEIPPSEPVQPQHEQAFQTKRDKLMKSLEQIKIAVPQEQLSDEAEAVDEPNG